MGFPRGFSVLAVPSDGGGPDPPGPESGLGGAAKRLFRDIRTLARLPFPGGPRRPEWRVIQRILRVLKEESEKRPWPDFARIAASAGPHGGGDESNRMNSNVCRKYVRLLVKIGCLREIPIEGQKGPQYAIGGNGRELLSELELVLEEIGGWGVNPERVLPLLRGLKKDGGAYRKELEKGFSGKDFKELLGRLLYVHVVSTDVRSPKRGGRAVRYYELTKKGRELLKRLEEISSHLERSSGF